MRRHHCAKGPTFAKLWSAPEEMLLRRLILTNSASGAGSLKMARIGDLTIGVSMLGGQVGLARYSVVGPLPDDVETGDFFGPQRSREAIFWQSIRGPIKAEITAGWLMGLSEFCRSFDAVECWFDPDADGQLNLVHLLDHVRQDPETAEKTVLVQPDAPVGGITPLEILASNPPRASLDPGHLDVAHRFWTAYRQPTPEAFAELLDADLSTLPHLDRLVPRLLAELPSAETGLGATEMQILERIAGPGRIWKTIFPPLWREQPPLFSYGYAEHALEGLAGDPGQAVSGVLPDPVWQPGPFDRDVFRAHRQSRLSLTPLGRALVERREDYAHHGQIDRWWGNTVLQNEGLWRWDAAGRRLTRTGG